MMKEMENGLTLWFLGKIRRTTFHTESFQQKKKIVTAQSNLQSALSCRLIQRQS